MIAEAQSESVRGVLLAVDLAFALAEATGRRIGGIRQLRWEDIDLTRKEITWRAESDKVKRQWRVPIPDSLCEELRQVRKRLRAISGWVFPAP